ncbi:unnamed protein product [Mytilus coruscus]|uniref:Uncharacterized protein n=1 Tax=Mytilus coruscus TaxID=42192 RepID=A0A6J8BKN7_MYTCO|nr:unnamed protein product [Mytilus coruscus]
MNDNKYSSYGLFAAGFVVVLLLSIGCNICINNYRNKAIQPQLGQQQTEVQNLKIGDENIQELGSVDAISNVSSKYETINENDLAVLNDTNRERKIKAKIFSRNLSPLFDQSYLEVIGDDVVSTEETIKSIGKSSIKIKTLKSEEPYTDDIDAEVDSYRSMNSKLFEESNISSTSSSPIHVDIECVNKLIDIKVISTKKKEFMNPYLTLNTDEMNNCRSCYTTVKPDTKSRITTEKQSFIAMKRHSCP